MLQNPSKWIYLGVDTSPLYLTGSYEYNENTPTRRTLVAFFLQRNKGVVT